MIILLNQSRNMKVIQGYSSVPRYIEQKNRGVRPPLRGGPLGRREEI